jgi:hypothetical protein
MESGGMTLRGRVPIKLRVSGSISSLQIQIVVSRVGEEVEVTTMTRDIVHQSRNRLPPLILPGKDIT